MSPVTLAARGGAPRARPLAFVDVDGGVVSIRGPNVKTRFLLEFWIVPDCDVREDRVECKMVPMNDLLLEVLAEYSDFSSPVQQRDSDY